MLYINRIGNEPVHNADNDGDNASERVISFKYDNSLLNQEDYPFSLYPPLTEAQGIEHDNQTNASLQWVCAHIPMHGVNGQSEPPSRCWSATGLCTIPKQGGNIESEHFRDSRVGLRGGG